MAGAKVSASCSVSRKAHQKLIIVADIEYQVRKHICDKELVERLECYISGVFLQLNRCFPLLDLNQLFASSFHT